MVYERSWVFSLWVLYNICKEQWSLDGERGALVSAPHCAANTLDLCLRHWKRSCWFGANHTTPLSSASLFPGDLVSHKELISYTQVKCSPKAWTPLDPAQAVEIFLLLSSQVLQTRSRVSWWVGETWHEAWGWNNTTIKALPGTQMQAGQHVLYLLYLYLPTLYTLWVATGLFLGHFRNIYFCKSYFWELCQIGNCSNLYIPRMDVHQTAAVILFLATPRSPRGEGTSVCRKKECKINAPTRLWKS